jgi:hypothetical protein
MTRLRLSLATLAACALVTAVAVAQKPNLKPGRYDLTIKMEMQGLPQQMPPMTIQKCMTADDVKDPMELAKKNQKNQNDCQMTSMKRDGNKVTWALDCKGKGKGTGVITLGNDEYQMTSQMEMVDKGGAARKMTSTVNAKRTGECTGTER